MSTDTRASFQEEYDRLLLEGDYDPTDDHEGPDSSRGLIEARKRELRKILSSKTWWLEEAVWFVRYIQSWVEPYRYHAGMVGSVLTKGYSINDLDMVLYPASTKALYSREPLGVVPREYLPTVLHKAGMVRVFDRAFVTEQWRKAGSDDEKHVEVWKCTPGIPACADRRVDVFFLS